MSQLKNKLDICNEVRKLRISKKKLETKIPNWIELSILHKKVKDIIYNIDYLVFKDTKVFDKIESKLLKRNNLLDSKRIEVLGLFSENSLIRISIDEFNKLKDNCLIICDRTEKQITDITINQKSKSRYIKGITECIFHLKYENNDFSYLDITDFKLTKSDRVRIIKRLENEIKRELNLKMIDKLPPIPDEYNHLLKDSYYSF